MLKKTSPCRKMEDINQLTTLHLIDTGSNKIEIIIVI